MENGENLVAPGTDVTDLPPGTAATPLETTDAPEPAPEAPAPEAEAPAEPAAE